MPRMQHRPTNPALAAQAAGVHLLPPHVPESEPESVLHPIAVHVARDLTTLGWSIVRLAPPAEQEASSDLENPADLREAQDVEDPREPGAEGLQARVAALLEHALTQLLTSPTAESKALRMGLIAQLALQEAGGMAARGTAPIAAAADALLTTAQAAARLGVSRPYVSMLCDQGKLGDVTLTEGGHRRVRASAVEAYRKTSLRLAQGATSPRQAGVDAGLYAFPEGHFKNVVRKSSSAKQPATPKRAIRGAGS